MQINKNMKIYGNKEINANRSTDIVAFERDNNIVMGIHGIGDWGGDNTSAHMSLTKEEALSLAHELITLAKNK